MHKLLPFMKLMRNHAGWALLGLLAGLLTLLASIGLLTLAGWFISAAALAGITLASAQAFNYFTPGAGVRGFAILRTLGRYAERIATHEATFRLLAQLRVWFYTRLEALGPAHLQRYRAADLLNRLVADVEALDNLYLRVIVPTLIATLVSGLGVIFLLFFSLPIALIASVGLLLAGLGVPWLAHHAGRRLGQRQVELTALLRMEMTGTVQGLADLSIYGGVRAAVERAQKVERRLYSIQRRMALITGVSTGLVVLISGLSALLVLMLGVMLVGKTVIEPAQLAMLVFCVLAMFEAVAPLSVAYQYLGRTLAAAERLQEIADVRPEIEYPEQPADTVSPGQIRFSDVSFRYNEDAPLALCDVSFDIQPGESVLLLGPSGSGKSTLLSLLARFHDVDKGSVQLSGVPLTSFTESQLRAQISTLSQPVELFAGTVAENLRLASPEADDALLYNALSRVCLDQELGDDPLNHSIGESGGRLSGGQRKRLALARALLRKAPVLWLDEPTEGLDSDTERQVIQALLDSREHKTLVIISHHLQMADHFDRIVILEAGRILEQGRPKDLMADQSSRFNELLRF